MVMYEAYNNCKIFFICQDANNLCSGEKLRRLLIDTDTGSDDVWAIIGALRATDLVKVEAITVVCGNVALDLCVKNALTAVNVAQTYTPPVYRGMTRPLMREKLFTADYVHGKDGLSNLNLPDPPLNPAEGHAIDAIIDVIMDNPGEIEIVTLGPLTNIAMAYLKEPRIAKNIKKIYIMGATGLDQGNANPAAEFNVYVDPEAAKIVMDSGMNMLWVTWDVCRGDSAITPADIAFLKGLHSAIADFCLACTACLREYEQKKYKNETFGVIDSIIMMGVIYPEVFVNIYPAYCDVETKEGLTYGYVSIDKHGQVHKEPNVLICQQVHAQKYKEYLFKLLQV
jgi:purine nucleosidase